MASRVSVIASVLQLRGRREEQVCSFSLRSFQEVITFLAKKEVFPFWLKWRYFLFG
jgi:hypothetical protein